MPLLAGGRLRGRVDPVRRGTTLHARRVFLDGASSVEPMASALAEAATWAGCDAVVVEQAEPGHLAAPLNAALARGGLA